MEFFFLRAWTFDNVSSVGIGYDLHTWTNLPHTALDLIFTSRTAATAYRRRPIRLVNVALRNGIWSQWL
jgi:hypothetical protein